ncbi:hypothetical protein [Streptomyces chartreusis]|uniref:hypothetical protein n=1 Tax=Streptomyces chartreusis TaxID=1969 RepID=UPI002E18232E
MRWTLAVTPTLGDDVCAVVTAACTEWGAAPHQVDLLAETAAQYAEKAGEEAAAYVTVSATLEGARATIGVIRAAEPAPDHAAALRVYEEPTGDSTGGTLTLAAGHLHYFSVNLGVRRPPQPARRTDSHHYLTTEPGAPERAAHNVGMALGMWGVPLPVVASLATTARTLVADAAASGYAGDIAVVSVLHGLTASVHAMILACATHSAALADVVDPVTAACVREAAGLADDRGCPCVVLAMPGPHLRRGDYTPADPPTSPQFRAPRRGAASEALPPDSPDMSGGGAVPAHRFTFTGDCFDHRY